MRNFIILVTALILIAGLFSKVLAVDIGPKGDYSRSDYGANWTDTINGVTRTYPGFETGVHPQGTWNNPFTEGLDSYNYNDPQDYTEPHTQVVRDEDGKEIIRIAAGPHGSYLTTTHKCRECHSVHEATGTYKLSRASTRYETCTWCHGFGAGSGFNIETDTDADFTMEHNVGHTMGYGVSTGKWRAPDDTYPAYTPNYWQGGFSCFDCHSPHANPQRILGFSNNGMQTYPVYNPGYDNLTSSLSPSKEAKYPAGSWILLKNPDRELDPETGLEISDTDSETAFSISSDSATETVAVNKIKTDWDKPIGLTEGEAQGVADDGFNINEFCADCHDGNAGLSNNKVAMFSEERAAQGETELKVYQVGSGHDSNQRLLGAHYVFDPEDGKNYGPACRNCHRGSSDCSICHSTSAELSGVKWPRQAYTADTETAIATAPADWGGPGYKTLYIAGSPVYKSALKRGTNVSFAQDWRLSAEIDVSAVCSNDGFSFPHKTLSWKLLKDNLFGVDFDGTTFVGPGEVRHFPDGTEALDDPSILEPAHDLDSVCLDCHNPEVWNPEYKSELILKGLP